MGQSKYNVQTPGTPGGSNTTGTTLTAVGDYVVFDVRDMSNISAWVNRAHTGTSATVSIQTSVDGVNWAQLGTIQDSGIAIAGVGGAANLTISDANAMCPFVEQVKFVLTAVAGGCTYTCAVAGLQRDGYR